MPCFMIGAGLGRCFGETMVLLFPRGISPNLNRTEFGLIPGAYAVAGAGAFAGDLLLPLHGRRLAIGLYSPTGFRCSSIRNTLS